MTQRIPADARLGRTNAGKPIGFRVLNLSRTVLAAFTRANVVETSIPGHYAVMGGIDAPDAGGYIVWGTAEQDIAEAGIDPAPVDMTPEMERRVAALLDILTERVLRAIALIDVAPVVEMVQPADPDEAIEQLTAVVARLNDMAEAAKQMRQAVVIADHLAGQLGEYAGTMSRVQEVEAEQRRRLVAIDDFLRQVAEVVA